MIARAIDSLKQVKLAMTNICFLFMLTNLLSTPVIAAQIVPQPPAPANPALADMQDIIAPEAISTFPSAPGYYLSTILILILIAAVISTLINRRRRLAPLKHGIVHIGQLDSTASINDISSLIKRVLLSYLPRETVAPLSGEKWLHFLRAQLSQKQSANFDINRFIELLGQGYQRASLPQNDIEQLKQLSCQWLTLAIPAISKNGYANSAPQDAAKNQGHTREAEKC